MMKTFEHIQYVDKCLHEALGCTCNLHVKWYIREMYIYAKSICVLWIKLVRYDRLCYTPYSLGSFDSEAEHLVTVKSF